VEDFNYHDIEWLTLSGINLNSSSFCDFVFDTNLIQLVENPTHIAGHTLDLILTNYNLGIQNLTLDSKLPPQLLSDHFMIKFDVICSVCPSARQLTSTLP